MLDGESGFVSAFHVDVVSVGSLAGFFHTYRGLM